MTAIGEFLRVQNKRMVFHIGRETESLEKILPGLPDGEIYKVLGCGAFSAIGFVRYTALKTAINHLHVATFAFGARQAVCLDVLASQGRLRDCTITVHKMMGTDKADDRRTDRLGTIKEICDNRGWRLGISKQHLKVVLMDTDSGKYVLETSSNFNENPNIEQFSFEKNTELHAFYRAAIEEIADQGRI